MLVRQNLISYLFTENFTGEYFSPTSGVSAHKRALVHAYYVVVTHLNTDLRKYIFIGNSPPADLQISPARMAGHAPLQCIGFQGDPP